MTDLDDKDPLPAWQELSNALRSFFERRVPVADVEDLLQECYLKVSQGLPALQDHERLGAWIFRIARNLVVDHLRRRHRELLEDMELGEDDVVDRQAANAREPDLDLKIGSWLPLFVDQLPQNYAEVLRLSELQGLPHREIAGRLGLSVSGVKSRVQRGRALLRDKLLACCTLEFDRRGAIRDYERNRPNSCDC